MPAKHLTTTNLRPDRAATFGIRKLSATPENPVISGRRESPTTLPSNEAATNLSSTQETCLCGQIQPCGGGECFFGPGDGSMPGKTSHWCGRRESNPHRPFEPCGFSYRLRLSPPGHLPARFAVWTIPSPSPVRTGLRCCPSSLYTFPAGCAGLGSGLPRIMRVPRIWAVLHRRFPKASTQVHLKSAASAIPPRPRGGLNALLS
jgi:hypothetical protein